MSIPKKYYLVYDERINEPCGYVDSTNENLMYLLRHRGYDIITASGGYTLDEIMNIEHAPINNVWVHAANGYVGAVSTGRGIELCHTQFISFRTKIHNGG